MRSTKSWLWGLGVVIAAVTQTAGIADDRMETQSSPTYPQLPYPDSPAAEPQRTESSPSERVEGSNASSQNYYARVDECPQDIFLNTSMKGDFFAGFPAVKVAGQSAPSSLSIAAGDRRHKFTDNASPIPQNRVFYNFNNFQDAATDINLNSQDVNRSIFGFEKTFFEGWTSFEVRVPFAAGLDATQMLGSADTTGTEFGNFSSTMKVLLWKEGRFAASGGLGLIFPTAESAVFQAASTLTFENEALHLVPFAAVEWRANERTWFQFIVHGDVATGTNAVDSTGQGGFGAIHGRYRDQALLFIDSAFGYWFYQDHEKGHGIAGFMELHYTTTLEDDCPIGGPPTDVNADFVGNPFNRLDVLNFTCGVQLLAFKSTTVSLFGVAPLRSGEEAPFDAEFGLQLQQRF